MRAHASRRSTDRRLNHPLIMRLLGGPVLVPARVAPLCLFFAGILATPCLVEQHLCPVAAFDRGIGSHRGMAFALKVLRHVSTPLAVLSVAILLSASA